MLQILLTVFLFLSPLALAQENSGVGTETTTEAAAEQAEEVLDKQAEELIKDEMKIPIAETPKVQASAKAENEIPVLSKAQVSAAAPKNSVERLVLSFAVLAVVAGIIILIARFWSKRKYGLARHQQIKVLTQYSLGPKKQLAIIRVAGESILIGITDHNINMIKSLALLDEDVPLEVPNEFRSEVAQAEQQSESDDREGFSFGGVKDVVASRIREMRSLQ